MLRNPCRETMEAAQSDVRACDLHKHERLQPAEAG